jgi:hypothetical protein
MKGQSSKTKYNPTNITVIAIAVKPYKMALYKAGTALIIVHTQLINPKKAPIPI